MTKETFLGFQWSLRLRYVLENAQNLEQATLLWQHTNNTLGMNHMVGSFEDKGAVAMETMARYTAYFRDNDPREANMTYNKNGKVGIELGYVRLTVKGSQNGRPIERGVMENKPWV